MTQLKSQRNTNKTVNTGAGAASGGSTLAAAGAASIAAQSAIRSQTAGANSETAAFKEGSPVDVLLFGFRQNEGLFGNTSFNQSQGSHTDSIAHAHVVKALQHLLKVQPMVRFGVATVGPDGRRLYSEEQIKAAGGLGKMTQEAQL